ncbi:MAG: NAD+ synthase [Thermodesulfobacteriota bacterium]
MKIALVQLNPVIGDFEANCSKIRKWATRAYEQGCELVVFPEMAVTGYPPQDLLERSGFVEAQQKAFGRLLSELSPLTVILGAIEARVEKQGKLLYNSLLVIKQGEVVHRVRKQLLPNYDVFDERRYFEPGPSGEFFTVGSLTLGLTVCEDIWHEEIGLYESDPVEELMNRATQQGVAIDCLVNISASPFELSKERVRRELFSSICTRYQVPLIYSNQVGGQDSLLFDGRSRLIDQNGRVAASCQGFAEDMVVLDSDSWQGEMHLAEPEVELHDVYQALVMGTRDYVRKCGFSSVVLGLSGGIDSALTAALAVEALGSGNVTGVALPSIYSSDESLADARQLAKNLGCRFEVIPIRDLVDGFQTSLAPLFAGMAEDVTEQNLQARIRGNLLMALSNKFGSMLLSTGNKSEMAVGYCTLYGDMSGGLAVISDVPKMLVYELAHHVNREGEWIPHRTITRPPTAELKPDQCDQDDLPPYEILDQILAHHLEGGLGMDEITAHGFEEDVVADVLRRVRINEYKRKQAPMGLRVTSKAFGYGRRFPTVQNFQK